MKILFEGAASCVKDQGVKTEKKHRGTRDDLQNDPDLCSSNISNSLKFLLNLGKLQCPRTYSLYCTILAFNV